MNRVFRAVILALCALPMVALADLKLGYVDLQRALTEVGEGQAAKARLEEEVDKRKTEFDAEQNKLRDDKADPRQAGRDDERGGAQPEVHRAAEAPLRPDPAGREAAAGDGARRSAAS